MCVCTIKVHCVKVRADAVRECVCFVARAVGVLWVRGRGRHGYEVRCAGGG